MADELIENQPLIDSPEERNKCHLENNNSPRSWGTPIVTLFVISVALNLAQAALLMSPMHVGVSSRYADLTWSVLDTWHNASEYMNRHHKTTTDLAWDSIDWNAGMVAIHDKEAQELGLPKAQRFPWDDSKGIYLINAYHNLHCLKWLWKSLAKFRDGGQFENVDWHGFHCLDSLRQDTICFADDTPRYTGEGQDNATSGFQQMRMCRDWTKLERWAADHNACYRFLGPDIDDTFDRWKFCPKSSPYNDVMASVYGPNEPQRLIDVYGEAATRSDEFLDSSKSL